MHLSIPYKLICIFYVKTILCYMLCFATQSCPTLCHPMDCSPPGSSDHRDSPSKNIGVSCHALLPKDYPTSCKINTKLYCSASVFSCLSHLFN